MNISQRIASEINTRSQNVDAVITLLDDGATIPFIARYRKEVTGGLDDAQLRTLHERLSYLRELADRKKTILKSITEQGKITSQLQTAIENVDNKTALEDLYLPYKPKRRTKAQMAREQRLETLAQTLLDNPTECPHTLATSYVSDVVTDAEAALDGARHIIVEICSEQPELVGELRTKLWAESYIQSTVVKKNKDNAEKFRDYFEHCEPIRSMPSHRALAVLRGKNEGVLRVSLSYQPENAPKTALSHYEKRIASHLGIENRGRPADAWLLESVRCAWKTKLFPLLESDALSQLKTNADTDAITVFARNLKDLLLAAPAGRLTTLGLDPGFRTGIKVAVVDDTAKLVDTAVVYLHKDSEAQAKLTDLIKKHDIKLVAIGNGTASRETDALAAQVLASVSGVQKVVVSEAGASVYSASELASQEFPNIDVSLRGAASIARRLQDPLAELVKIDPKAIGVGQYQHDVNQTQLAQVLDTVVEDCVNAVGVDVNMASAPLLARISGLNATHAQNIVAFRDLNGAFSSRKQLMKVPRLGAKTYEQAAGFLRIHAGIEPLDASAVHPEAYSVVAAMVEDKKMNAQELIGNQDELRTINPRDYTTEQFGLPTVRDILSELEKPGRDPRGEFITATFAEGINTMADLYVGMVLEGVVSNVANFGAFVDIGVHQDGLVHISSMSDTFVRDPHEVVKAGDVVKVQVVEVDEGRKRIALTMRLGGDTKSAPAPKAKRGYTSKRASNNRRGALGSALSDAFGGNKNR